MVSVKKKICWFWSCFVVFSNFATTQVISLGFFFIKFKNGMSQTKYKKIAFWIVTTGIWQLITKHGYWHEIFCHWVVDYKDEGMLSHLDKKWKIFVLQIFLKFSHLRKKVSWFQLFVYIFHKKWKFQNYFYYKLRIAWLSDKYFYLFIFLYYYINQDLLNKSDLWSNRKI